MRSSSANRLANVERLRLVAMFEIVAFHVSEHRLPIVAGLGLPVFLLLNNAFNTTLTERMGTPAFLNVKVSRLLVPWILWSLIYLAIVLLERWRHDEPLTEDFSIWMLIGGTYVHLWFVPFALASSVLIAWLQARTGRFDAWAVTLAHLLCGTILTVFNAWLLAPGAIQWPALQWLFALPALPFGFAFGRAILGGRPIMIRLACFAGVAAALGLGLAFAGVVPEMVRRYGVSLLLISLAFLWPGRSEPFSQRLSPLLLGIYLSHPLLVRAYQAAHLPALPAALFAALIFAAAAALVAVLRRGPLRALV
jgi:surface polysaccharide O-acyltransferase-like enzyme